MVSSIFSNSKCDSLIDKSIEFFKEKKKLLPFNILVVNTTTIVTKTDFHKLFLIFHDERLEKEYNNYRVKRNIEKMRIYYLTTLLFYFIYLLGKYLFFEKNDDDMNIFYLKISLTGFLILLGLLIMRDIYEAHYTKISFFVKKYFYFKQNGNINNFFIPIVYVLHMPLKNHFGYFK